MQKNRLQKPERIYLREDLRQLFDEGSSFVSYPLRIVYQIREGKEKGFPISILISVPKKRFKHAVDRNRIKRLIRESFRQQKHNLSNTLNKEKLSIHFAVICLIDELPDYTTIYKAMGKALKKLEKNIFESGLENKTIET